ncbi:MAG: universal stress protein [Actinobacteria bacterium]|nr:universal stress protein [Actinomycetota bacterium]
MSEPRLASIVVGVDDSPGSRYALDLAAAIGGALRATMTIVHVRPQSAAFGLGPEGSIEYSAAQDELDRVVAAEVSSRLADFAGTWSMQVRSGNVGRELMAAADEVDADLVVVGHSRHGALRDAVLGSTAASAVHHSRRSVLVAIPPA